MSTGPARDQSAHTAPGLSGADMRHEGPVGHGRAGSAKFTGTRAIASARFIGAIGRGGVHGRTWLRGHDPDALRELDTDTGRDDPAGDALDLPQSRDEGPRA
jgi:hypothetical protein